MCGFQIRFTFYEYKCINDQILWSFKDSANKEQTSAFSFSLDGQNLFRTTRTSVQNISEEDLHFADLLMIIYELLKTIKTQLISL